MRNLDTRVVLATVIYGFVCQLCSAQSLYPVVAVGEATSSSPRVGISGGMGVSYVNALDIVDRINATLRTLGVTEQVSDFNAAVEFFGAVAVPFSEDWAVKLEYAYVLASYNVTSTFLNADFSFVAHMPTIIAQYILVEEGLYNVKVGIGAGYHFGSFSEEYGIVNDKHTGKGVGTKFDLEANTAFGEDFFGYLGADRRWEFIGKLSNTGSSTAGASPIPTLDFFGVGAKLGFTYYF